MSHNAQSRAVVSLLFALAFLPPSLPPSSSRSVWIVHLLTRYRGIELEALLDLKPVELTKLFPARSVPPRPQQHIRVWSEECRPGMAAALPSL